MKKVLKGKRAYIDTNIFIYVAVKNPDFYKPCLRILEMLIDGVYLGYGSKFVLFELFGALSKLSPMAALEASNDYLNLPINLLDVDRNVLQIASLLSEYSKTTYDSLHAALMMANDINVVITEDIEDWTKIKKAWNLVAKKRKINVDKLIVFSPTQGVI